VGAFNPGITLNGYASANPVPLMDPFGLKVEIASFQIELRIVSVSLAGILATGVGIIAITPGALGETRWMKIAFALFLLLGLLHGIVGNQFRRARRGGQSALSSGLVAGMLWTMCGIVVAITYLMEVKPS
jgi:uncharacterized membrane protein